MTRTAFISVATAAVLGGFCAFHQPARAGAVSILQTATSGNANWIYTVGASGQTYNFAPITGTDWLGGGTSGGTTAASPSPPATGGAPSPSSLPEPGALALLGMPLFCLAAILRRRR